MKTARIALGFILVFAVIGCKQASPSSLREPISQAEQAKHRKGLPQVDAKQIASVCEANNQFSLDVLKELMKEKSGENIVLSPLSLAQDLALVHESAKGETQKMIEKVLRLSGKPSNALASFHVSFLQDMESDKMKTLSMANGIWVSTKYKTRADRAAKLEAWFGCSVQPLSTDLSQAKDEMDRWVQKNTHGLIKEIKTELSNLTRLMFLNALYFNGKWEDPFDKQSTMSLPFHAPTGDVDVQMMQKGKTTLQGNARANAPGVEFAFKGDRYSLVAIVPPNSGDFKRVVAQLSGSWLTKYRSEMTKIERILQFPKLDLTQTHSLDTPVKALGGEPLYKSNLDLSALVDQGNNQEPLFVSSILQQVRMKLDETGVEAAAVTEVSVAGSAELPERPRELYFNRPFVFFLIHKPTGAIVLCGVINDPTKS